MFLQVNAAILVVLALFIQCIEGYERVIVVSNDTVDDTVGGLFSYGEDNNTASSVGSSNTYKSSCCTNGNCSCPSLYNALANLTSDVLINVMTNIELFSRISLSDLTNVRIAGHNNPTVECSTSGGLHFTSCHNCTVTGINWRGCGGNISDDRNAYPVLQLCNSSNITIENCSFQNSTGQVIVLSEVSGDVHVNNCNFLSSKQYEGHGTTLHYSSTLLIPLLNLMITNCSFLYNERARSIVYFDKSSTIKSHEYLYLQNSNFHYNKGVPIYVTNQNLFINGKVEFFRNVAENGGGIFISNYSNVTFYKSAIVNFSQNAVSNNGGAIFLTNHSSISFTEDPALSDTLTGQHSNDNSGATMYSGDQGDSIVEFNGNDAFGHGGAVYIDNHSTITFEGDCTVVLDNNTASSNGGAVCINNHSTITFEGNSTVVFKHNKAHTNGGGIYAIHSSVTFGEHSAVTFQYNRAAYGGALYLINSAVMFAGNSAIAFESNGGLMAVGGAVYAHDSSMIFKENTTVTFEYNVANNGGAMYIAIDVYYDITCTFEGNSSLVFKYNTAMNNGGAMYVKSSITFEGNSTAVFNNNKALSNGGAVYAKFSTIEFKGNSMEVFNSNEGVINGGGMCAGYSSITVGGNSTVLFNKNKARENGGTMYIANISTTAFTGNCKVVLNNSEASSKGGAIHVNTYSRVIFEGNSTVAFTNNHAVSDNGGALYSYHNSAVMFKECSTVTFYSNNAHSGGAVSTYVYSHVTFQGYSKVSFYNNTARKEGGAIYIDYSSIIKFSNSSTVRCYNNSAILGGGIFVTSSHISIEENCSVEFTNNTASQDGGAIFLSDHSHLTHFNNSTVIFNHNVAGDYGAAVYASLKISSINFTGPNIYFNDNTAGTSQKPVYIYVPKSYNNSRVMESVNIINKKYIPLETSPSKLILYHPVQCISGNDMDCHTYYMNNVMLGQEITFDACLLDYYDQPTKAAQFSIASMSHQDYNISGLKYTTISCNHTTREISIVGNLHSNNSYNYSIIISLNVVRISKSKVISVNLTVELSQCHPGFWYSSGSQICECYNTRKIVSCTKNNSTIKRGYWFGSVNGIPTVTSCPNDYCNFTCCEITNGFYHLSPVRANQCMPHRSGTVCGDCEEGYTLSFDSPQCVEVNKCKIGQTALVIVLSMLYCIAVVVAVFILMYFKVTVGSLYAIIYYYSVVDILLSQDYFILNRLYTTVSIMSSLAKLTPKFLGQLCLVKNMSGIDQQFIHYVHPTFVSFILIMISVLARRSRRVSSFISRGIIHVICFLLLLSYTSVATTSLLLMRPLKFMDIDKIYTYLSPDIEYSHSRHLAYIIVAIVFVLVIVIGFPLLLLLEPFVNSKINFVKIKPLLDQFQCCYKDKYRYFSAYYMICRLVIILLIIVRIFDEFTTQFLLISSCALMQLIHVLVRPYASTIHNIFDGIILQLIVIISALPVVEYVDDYHETSVLVVTYILLYLPIVLFIAIKIWINGNNIENTFEGWIVKFIHKYKRVPIDDVEEPTDMNQISLIVDDNMRRNATVVDM